MSHPKPADDNPFDPNDDFLDDQDPGLDEFDPFLDADEVERRMFSQGLSASAPQASPASTLGDEGDFDSLGDPQTKRPFGARLADANRAETMAEDYHDFDSSGSTGFDNPFEGPAVHAPAPVTPAQTDPTAMTLEAMHVAPEMSVQGGLYGEIDEDDPTIYQPIPRIDIQAFCESPETGRLIHTAGNDRRLAKAHVTVELGGLAAAIERFHDHGTPNLLIIETGMRGQGLFDQLDELAGVCDGDTKVVIIGAANDITLYRELIRRGISEYLVPPFSPLHMIKTISELFLDPEAPFAGKSIAFIGAKGGVGSSTIAHNVAWSLTENLRSDAVLVDLDLSFGTAGLDFNQDPAQTISDALDDPDRLDDALLDRLLVRCSERLTLFSAPATLEREWQYDPEAYENVLDKVRRQAPYVTLDLPHQWSPWVRHTLLSADQVIVTVTPDLACLRNAKNMFDLIRQNRPNDEPPKVVVNMASCPKRPEIPLKDFTDALGASPALVLPFEPELFGKAANNGQMVGEVDQASKAAEGFAHLAGAIAGRPIAPVRQSFFKKLFSR
ncbi:AAA family ATPase [Woodsholea maritima]|uniref:AAA family ATPase n=1 Tax=Woodsholea maritima TaxID=240237 RepID=UPI0003774532|nr:AAA family ATPase [Woodsholea maritima]